MPFSWYSFPATEGEFKTEFDGGLFLRVLQAWNVRTLQDETLEKSWLVGELPAKDMEDAWKFWQYTIGQGEIDDELLQRSGLPIAWDSDPRLRYKHDELANFAKLDAEDMAAAESSNVLYLATYIPDEAEVAMAAGEEAEDLQFTYTLPERGIICNLEYFQAERQFFVNVFDADGAVSTALDGCQLRNRNSRQVMGTICNGKLTVACELAPDLALIITDADGNDLRGEFASDEGDD
jgi:hypothetical protein